MKRITPYKTVTGAVRALDNGGRFYNLFTTAGDDTITKAELAKVAGAFKDMQTAMLFFDLATLDLSDGDRQKLTKSLGPKLRKARATNRTDVVSPAEFVRAGRAGKSYLIEGVPEPIDEEAVQTGVIMVPMMIGKVMMVMPMPTSECFSVYTLGQGRRSPCLILAKKSVRLSSAVHRFAGVAKATKMGDGPRARERLCLQPAYYSVVDE